MVWNPEQSPLYKCVEDFNKSESQPECGPGEKNGPAPPKCEAGRPAGTPRCSPPTGGNLFQRLTSDRDFLLIAALILLLWHEKADMKLIAALAYVLLA